MTNDIVLSLAGIAQSANLVYELANYGNCSEQASTTSINSIYKINSESVCDIYDGANNLKLGLVQLQRIFVGKEPEPNKDIIRYFMSLMTLEKKLSRQENHLIELRKRLEQILKQVDYFSPFHEIIISNLASIYSDILGQFKLKIMVTGKPQYLHANDIVHKIRALLLAGVRSAVLWRQLGGNRWQFLFQRSRILAAIERILSSCDRC